MNKLWTILCMNCKYNMYSLWMKYEQIVNKIIFILFYRTLYRGSIYRSAIYDSITGLSQVSSNFTWHTTRHHWVKCFYLTDITCKNVEYPSYSNIFPNIPISPSMGIFYIIKHLFDCETRAMCSTHTSRPKSHITHHSPITPYIINCIKFPHNSL